jgi:polyhydroxybutyrate depolymerase
VKKPQAIILAFHGLSMNAHDMEQYTGLSSLADQENFIAVYPLGTVDSDGQPSWAIKGAGDPPTDDVLFVSDLLNRLQATLCIDAQRIYAAGYSRGGGMVGLLACAMAKRIAAFAPVAGIFSFLDSCQPGRSVPVLEFHGTADPEVSYTDPGNGWEAIPDWFHDWAKRDGCSSGPAVFVQTADVTGEQWSGCGIGGAVVHYRIEGGGHTWPGAQFDVPEEGPTTHTIDANAIMWQFFQTHPLPVA